MELIEVFLSYVEHSLEVLELHCFLDLGNLLVGILIIVIDYVRCLIVCLGVGRIFLISSVIWQEWRHQRTSWNFLSFVFQLNDLLIIKLMVASPVVQVAEVLLEALELLALRN